MVRRAIGAKLLLVLLVFALMMVIPLFVKDLLYIQLFITAAIMAIAVMGMDVLFGYVGYVSFGQAGFIAIGAYTTAFLMAKVHVSVPLAILCGMFLSAFMAYLLSFAIFRLSGICFAIGTMAFGQLVWVICFHWRGVTGGMFGIFGLKTPGGSLPNYYYFVFLIMFAVLFLLRRLVKSPIGEALTAIRGNEKLAECAGIPTLKSKRFAFVLSGIVMALAGGLWVCLWSFATTESFTLSLSLQVLVITMIGGVGTLVGPAVAAFVLQFLMKYLSMTVPALTWIIYGALLILTVMFLPGGLAGSFYRVVDAVRARRKEAERISVTIDSTGSE